MNILFEAKNFMLKCARVWRITRKPTTPEFKMVSKASMIGLLIIGLIGFLISFLTGILNL